MKIVSYPVSSDFIKLHHELLYPLLQFSSMKNEFLASVAPLIAILSHNKKLTSTLQIVAQEHKANNDLKDEFPEVNRLTRWLIFLDEEEFKPIFQRLYDSGYGKAIAVKPTVSSSDLYKLFVKLADAEALQSSTTFGVHWYKRSSIYDLLDATFGLEDLLNVIDVNGEEQVNLISYYGPLNKASAFQLLAYAGMKKVKDKELIDFSRWLTLVKEYMNFVHALEVSYKAGNAASKESASSFSSFNLFWHAVFDKEYLTEIEPIRVDGEVIELPQMKYPLYSEFIAIAPELGGWLYIMMPDATILQVRWLPPATITAGIAPVGSVIAVVGGASLANFGFSIPQHKDIRGNAVGYVVHVPFVAGDGYYIVKDGKQSPIMFSMPKELPVVEEGLFLEEGAGAVPLPVILKLDDYFIIPEENLPQVAKLAERRK